MIMSEVKNASSSNGRQLAVKVAVTLACKIAVIVCLGFLFFGSDKRIETDAQTVGQAILADTASGSAAANAHTQP
jgi:hypothetical protein